jgi:hypothetical protein
MIVRSRILQHGKLHWFMPVNYQVKKFPPNLMTSE